MLGYDEVKNEITVPHEIDAPRKIDKYKKSDQLHITFDLYGNKITHQT